jgi:hypothetical protein
MLLSGIGNELRGLGHLGRRDWLLVLASVVALAALQQVASPSLASWAVSISPSDHKP